MTNARCENVQRIRSVMRLPSEMLLAILLYCCVLNIQELRLVCKRWSTLIQSILCNEASVHPIRQLHKLKGVYFMADDGFYHTRRTKMTTPPQRIEFKYNLAEFQRAFADELSVMPCGVADHEESTGADRRMVSLLHRSHAVTVLYNRLIVRCGGRAVGRDERLSSCFIIDPIQGTITPGPPMAVRRSAAAGAVVGHMLYVFGGFDGATELDTYEVLDLRTMQWVTEAGAVDSEPTRLRRMPYGICEHAAVQVCNRYVVLLAGCINRGRRNEASVAAVHALDTVTGHWIVLPEMPADRILGCAFAQSTAENGTAETCITYVGGAPLRRASAARSSQVTMQFFFPDSDLTLGYWGSRMVGGCHRELNTVCIQRALAAGPAEVISQGCLMSLASPSAARWEVQSRQLARCSVSAAAVLQ